jgi:hypothetical protein
MFQAPGNPPLRSLISTLYVGKDTNHKKKTPYLHRTQDKLSHISTTEKKRGYQEKEVFHPTSGYYEIYQRDQKHKPPKMVKGSCVCGDYTYEYQGEPLFVVRRPP